MVSRADTIINNPEYRHIKTLSYSDIVPFVIEYGKKRSTITFSAWVILFTGIVFLILFRLELSHLYSFTNILQYSLMGAILFPALLIVPHEILHIIPYYLFGARDIKIGANFKEFYFYVTANDFPVESKKFVVIAIAPMLIISLLLLLLALVIDNPLWSWSLFVSTLVHFTMCAGDITLINFIFLNRKADIITWDNVRKKEAYFYGRI